MLSAHYGKKILAILLVGLIGGAGLVQAAPRNVIIFIGDGMGPEQVKTGGIYIYGAAGSLSFESFPYQGQLTTYQYGGGITDSAAAATALATGYKVNGGVISMAYPGYPPDYPEGSELLTLLEYLKAHGKSTGLVSTAYITDATPAGFGAHEPSRSNYSQIAGDYLNQTHPNVLFGGGANGMSRSSAEAAGYTVVEDKAGMLALDTESVTRVSGQFGSTDLPYEYDGLGNLPHLSEMTTTALNILDNDPDGFFLMVEGGRIDDACHSNDLVRTIPEVNELADSVQAAIDWAAGRSDTLIIVAADHETGGLTVLSNNGAGNYPDVSWSDTGHTAANVPVYAWGVNAGFVSRVMDNTDIFGVVTADTVMLDSPSDGSVIRSTQVSFNCSATSDYNLIDATLYLGQASGTSNTVTFSGPADTDDAQISADNPNTNYGAVTPINVDGLTPHAHSVIKFPNIFGSGGGQVPSGSIIASATLKISCTNTGNIMKLYRLTEDWIEGQVTWNNRSSGTPWTAAGAQGGSNAGVAVNGDCTALGWRTIDITQFVQEWSNGAANYGIVFTDSGTDGVDFASSESANPPLLTVTYQSMQAIETKPLSGTSDSVTFSTLTLNDQNDYIWNCLVRSTNGQETRQTWAPFDSQFRVDSQIPDQPVLVAPADGATNASTSPTLEVTASDPQGGLVDVTFYGRAVPSPNDFFTIVVLPDTQIYSKSYPGIFTAQTQWIVNNITGKNIVFVTQEGDLVDTYNSTTEWTNANTSMSLLDGAVPYGVLAGNHDKLTDTLSGQYPDYPTDSTYYNQTFPYTRYQSQSWYGGHYPETGNNNNYQLFSAGGDDYIILHLEDTPGTNVIAWANSILTANSSRNAIITTHSYLDGSGNYNGKWGSTQYIRNMVVANSNVYFVLCGHLSTELTKTTTVGTRQVYELMADFQGEANGGNGWLRIMRFVPAESKVYIKTYSPWLGQYQTDGNSRFTLDIPMNDFEIIGTDTGVPSGQNASIVWSGLSVGTQYEWYAEVTDSTAKTRVGQVWSFTVSTTDTTPPVISAVASSGITQSGATITWTTDEASNSTVRYGTAAPLTLEASDAAMVTSHSVTLTGLTAEKPYYYEVQSTDATGNTAINNNSGAYYSFTTTAPDTQPPVITGATGNTLGTTGETVTISATITDNVDVIGATVHYTPIGGTETTTPMTEGSGNIWSGGVPVASNKVGTIIYYITAQDAAGNPARSPVDPETYSITVTDNDAPSKIIDLTATAIGGGSIELTWSLATDNIGIVSYNIYRDTQIIDLTGLTPIMTGITGTSYTDTPVADGTYYYAVTGIDSAGNEAQVSNSPSATIDTTPPVISTVTSTSITDSSATITWTTNEASNSTVTYGTATPPTGEASDTAMVTSHSVTITGLSAATTYCYQVKSTDAAGNTTTDNKGGTYYTFTTLTPAPKVLFSDGFESGNLTAGGWTVSGSATVSSAAAYNGSYGANLKKAASIQKAISTAGYKQIHIKFARKTTGMDAGEYLYAEWSSDGSVWNTLETTQGTTWTSRDLVCAAGADNNAGFRLRFRTNANLTAEYACVDAVEIIGTPLGPVNNPPAVTINLPTNGSTFASGASIAFEGTATDVEDGDLTGSLVWQSNIDGQIGTGGSFSKILSNGNHTITASVTDSGGKAANASVNIIVGNLPPGAPTGLAATAGNGNVTLDWADNTESDLAGYNVYRSTTQGAGYTKINSALVPKETSNYVDSTVTNGTTYYYVVTAVDTGTNESTYSNEVSATPNEQQKVHVQNINMSLTQAGKNWKAVAVVLIHNQSETPQVGATVTGNWYLNGNLIQSGVSGITDGSGSVVITSPPRSAKSGDIFMFSVTNVTLSGYTYSPNENVETTDSIVVL
jgi:alkaline phosphatase